MPALRAALPADLPACGELIRGQPLFEPYGLTPEGLTGALSRALAQGGQVIVAEHDGTITGLAWFDLHGAFGRSGYLRLLVTDARAQGQGIGAQLLSRAERLVFAERADFFLLVNAANTGARSFYERHGWHACGLLEDYVAPGLDEVIMRKTRA